MPARVALLLLFLLAACGGDIFPMPGVRLLTVEFRQGEEVVLTTFYEDPDARRAEDVWDYLSERPTMAGDPGPQLANSDALWSDLEGYITIAIHHGRGDPMKENTSEGLTLVRETAEDDRWHLREADRDRLRPR